MNILKTPNKSLKPTVTLVTPFAEKAKSAPRYGGLIPPIVPSGFFKFRWNFLLMVKSMISHRV